MRGVTVESGPNRLVLATPLFKTDQILEQQQRTDVTNSLVVLCPAANNSSGTNTNTPLPLEQATVGGPGGARFERLSRGLSCPAEDRTLTGVFTKPVRCYCLSFSSFSVKRFE